MNNRTKASSIKDKNAFASKNNINKQSKLFANKNISTNWNPSKKQAQNIYGKIDKKRDDPMAKYVRSSAIARGGSFQGDPRNSIKSKTSSTSVRIGKKYNLDSSNIFYEESSNMRELQMIRASRSILAIAFLALLFLYYIVSHVHPFTGYCPNNADCGAYINCHPGYELKGQLCKISQEILDNAEKICISEIERLKYQYGNTECLPKDDYKSLFSPSKRIDILLEELNIEDNRALIGEIQTWLDKKQNQFKHKFIFSQGKIAPTEKLHTFHCWLKKASEESSVQYAALAFVVFLVVLVFWIRKKAFKNKANQIYKYLKEKVRTNVDFVIEKQQIEQIFGHISLQMWTLVQFFRLKDGQIVYYIDSDSVHWIKNPH